MSRIGLLLLFVGSLGFGQSTSVTLQVTDTDSQSWNNGTWSATLTSNASSGPFAILGTSTPVPNQSQSGALSVSGGATMTLTPNASIGPLGTQWAFQVCPQANPAACYAFKATIQGASQNLTLTPPGIRISVVNPVILVSAYQDLEIFGQTISSTYYNLINSTSRQWNGSSWVNFGSGGGSGLPTATASGQVPVSISAGTVYAAQKKVVCDTRDMIGADVGAKVAACFGVGGPLNGIPGTILITQGGTWSTQVTVPSGIDIRLSSLAGNILNAMSDRTPILLMNSNTSLQCDSWSNSIQAPNVGNETLICGVDQGAGCTSTSSSISNVRVNGCHIVGSGGAGSPLIGVIWLENCVHCETSYNFFDNIKSIQLLLGASSSTGNRSQFYSAIGNVFTGSTNSPLAIINAQDFNLARNYFHLHGNGAAADIDMEPNGANDFIENGDIHDNVVDATDNLANFVDYGIGMQCAGFPNCKFVKIHDNLLWGGAPGTTIGKLQQGIGSQGSYIEMYNNFITNASSGEAIAVQGDHGNIHDNTMVCSTMIVAGVNVTFPASFNTITRNRIINSGCSTLSAPSVASYNNIWENNFSLTTPFAANNVYRDNDGVNGYNLASGGNSVIDRDPQIDATAVTFQVPLGAASGIAGALSISRLSPPTGLSPGIAVIGSCGLAANTYFYKVTATDSVGETTPSNEISFAAGGGNGCGWVTWNKVPGAKCYNVYRSTTTNTEQLITASPLCNGATSYPDAGGQTPGASLPTINSTGGLAPVSVTFANLPSVSNGVILFCSDCKNVTDDTTGTFDSAAASGGHGTLVLRENGAWRVH